MTYIDIIAAEIHHRLEPDKPPAEAERVLYLLYALLVLTVSESVTKEDVHNAWAAWIRIQGRDHPAVLPFSMLEPERQRLDERFQRVIRDVARRYPRQSQE
jgi:hypothetical protein